ncbi:MAG: VPLPA-CTERM sorting domain-containing protein, partial [Gemmobacter sp.]
PLAASAATVSQTVLNTHGDFIAAGVNLDASVTALLPAGASWAGDAAATVTGSVDGQYRSPFPDVMVQPADAPALPYFSVDADASPITLAFDKTQTAFSLVWGSIDSYNTLRFFLGDDEVTGFSHGGPFAANSLTGSILTPPGAAGTGASLVEISDILFDSVVFVTDQNSFEFSNIQATPIPLPAAGFLLMGALGGLAVIRRRRKDA